MPMEQYLKNSAERNPHLPTLFDGCENVMDALIKKLTLHFAEKGITFRRAQYPGGEITPYNAHNWIRNERSKTDGLAIFVHDDLSLAMDKRFDDFEIKNVKSAFAVNVCLENSDPSDGKLAFWNILPNVDDIKRKAKLFEYNPYKNVDMNRFQRRDFEIRTGDLYVFNGQFLHSVTDHKVDGENRLGISFFGGYLDDKTVIYWE